jgi:hypothetical protein
MPPISSALECKLTKKQAFCNLPAILVISPVAVKNQNMLYFSHVSAARGLDSVG